MLVNFNNKIAEEKFDRKKYLQKLGSNPRNQFKIDLKLSCIRLNFYFLNNFFWEKILKF